MFLHMKDFFATMIKYFSFGTRNDDLIEDILDKYVPNMFQKTEPNPMPLYLIIGTLNIFPSVHAN